MSWMSAEGNSVPQNPPLQRLHSGIYFKKGRRKRKRKRSGSKIAAGQFWSKSDKTGIF